MFFAITVLALIVGQVYAATVIDELKNMRDDVRSICYKVYGKDNGSKHCRPVGATDTQRHIVHECWKSGWSGRGNFRCNYAMDIYSGKNTINSGDQAVAPNANGGRRRLAEDDGTSNGMGSGLAEEDRALTAPPATHSANFHMENLEDEKNVEVLGNYSVDNSFCILQGVTMHESENVEPSCHISKQNGKWTLEMVSASCTALCVPRPQSQMF